MIPQGGAAAIANRWFVRDVPSGDSEDNGKTELELWDITQLEYLARQILHRSSNGMPQLKFKVPLKNLDLEVGDFVSVDNDLFLWRDVSAASCKWEIIKKTVDLFGGFVELEVAYAEMSVVLFPRAYIFDLELIFPGATSEYDIDLPDFYPHIDRGFTPGIEIVKGTSISRPIIGPGTCSGGGAPKALPMSKLMPFPPESHAAGVEEYIYYGVDVRTGGFTQQIVKKVDDVWGFRGESSFNVPICRVTKKTDNTLDTGSVIDLRPGPTKSSSDITAQAYGKVPTGVPNGDFSIWGSTDSMPDGWHIVTTTYLGMQSWRNVAALVTEVGESAPNQNDWVGNLVQRSLTTLTGVCSMVLKKVLSTDTYVIGGATKKRTPYQWKIISPTLPAMEVGGDYVFEFTCQSASTGTHFALALETSSSAAFGSGTTSKTVAVPIASADTWTTFSKDHTATVGERYGRFIITYTGYDKPDVTIDGVSIRRTDINPNKLTEQTDIPTPVASKYLRRNSGDNAFEWADSTPTYSNYVFRGYTQTDLTIAASGETTLTYTALINPQTGYWKADNQTWAAPADGYYKIRVSHRLADVTAAQFGSGGSPLIQLYITKDAAYQWEIAPSLLGSSLGDGSVIFQGEVILELDADDQITIRAIESAGSTFTIQGAAGIPGQRRSLLEISAVRLK